MYDKRVASDAKTSHLMRVVGEVTVGERGTRGSGLGGLQLADGVRLLRPDEQVFTAMLDGWRNQQLARNMSFGTVESTQRSVRAFAEQAQAL